MITKKYPSPSGLTIIVLLTAATASAGQLFTTTLSGSQEVPPNASPATGSGTVLLDDARTTITVNLTFTGLSAPATAAHIHGPANPGTNGPVVISFTGFPLGVTSGTYSSTFLVTPTQVSQLVTGQLYMDIHDSTFPGGEIRGQLPAEAHGDFDGDGKSDILLRDSGGSLGMWIINGSTITSGALVGSPGSSYTVAGIGDFNGDGKDNILLRDNLGNLGMWIMNGSTITSGALVGSPGLSYTVAATNDYNGDGKADILLRDSGGNVGVWIMNGSTITSGALVGSPGSGYTIY